MANQSTRWIIDKHIPLAFIFAVFVQTCGAIWWASAISSAVSRNAVDIAANKEENKENRSMKDILIRLNINQEKILTKIESFQTKELAIRDNKENEKRFQSLEKRIEKLEEK